MEHGRVAAVSGVAAMAGVAWFGKDIATWGSTQICHGFLEMLRRSIVIGTLDVSLPGRSTVRVGVKNPKPTDLHTNFSVHDAGAVLRILLKNDIGLGTGYCDGLWDSNDLAALFAILAANREAGHFNGKGTIISAISLAAFTLLHYLRANTLEGSKENIAAHYDLGNDMYQCFLDPTMTYSSAYFTDGSLDLEKGQLAKYDRILKEASVSAEDKVIEVGCGWGWFAIRAAQTTGCAVIGITLSEEQLQYAKAKVASLGLGHKVSFELLDYRVAAEKWKGEFDKVVSIEMIEAVGVEYLPTYFRALRDLVKPSGSIMVQAISMVEARYRDYCTSTDFIQQFIFPGGHCPCLAAIATAAGDIGLTIHGVEEFGLHYAETLRQWDNRFMASKVKLLQLGYTEHFIRMWHYYFKYCEAGFAARILSLYQIRFTKHFAYDRPDKYVDNPVFGISRSPGVVDTKAGHAAPA